jgi:hypothetical protein
MSKLVLTLAALSLLTGCARPGMLIGGVAAAALIVSVNKRDEREEGSTCRTVIRPNGGGGIGTNVTIC